MKTIRQNTFETNSSSTHSLTINTVGYNDIKDTVQLTVDGDLVLPRMCFGWEHAKYNDIVTKATYLGVYFNSHIRYNQPETKGTAEMKQWLDDILIEFTGCKKVIHSYLTIESGGNICICDDVHIDHCGEAKNLSEVIMNKENMKNFLTCNDSWLFTSNDNDREHPSLRFTQKDVEECIGIIGTEEDWRNPVLFKKDEDIQQALEYLIYKYFDERKKKEILNSIGITGVKYMWEIRVEPDMTSIQTQLEEKFGKDSIQYINQISCSVRHARYDDLDDKYKDDIITTVPFNYSIRHFATDDKMSPRMANYVGV